MGILDEINKSEELLNNVRSDIEEVYYLNDLPWVIGYSGGKDSTCTTQIIIDTLLRMKSENKELKKPVYVISSDTLVENPMIVGTIHNTVNSINKLAEKNDLPLSAHIIKPKYNNTFWANLIGRGYPCPNQTFRWCTDRMKINPANDFITEIVDKYGEAVMILGVRDGESNSRDRVLESHTIEGRKLMRHTTMANAYVFAPIRSFTIDDVWDYLLNTPSPWGQNNKELFDLYTESSEECDLIIDEEGKRKGTCGNSRFGCWVCTVVSKDKSLTAFIEKGVEWLKPLLVFRNWLYSIRDNESMRMKRRHDGTIYFSKISSLDDGTLVIPAKGDRPKITIKNIDYKWIDNQNNEWTVFENTTSENDAREFIMKNNVNLSDGSNPRIIVKKINGEYGQLGLGPFTQEAKEEILKRLLELQLLIGDKYKLFFEEELLEIRKLWFKYGVWNDRVSELYYEVFGKELNLISDDITLFNDKDLGILQDICNKESINVNVMLDIFNLEKKYMGYNNRMDVSKGLQKLLSQEFLHLEGQGEKHED